MVSSPHKRFDMKELKCPKCGNVFQVDEADICSGLSYYPNIHILKSLKITRIVLFPFIPHCICVADTIMSVTKNVGHCLTFFLFAAHLNLLAYLWCCRPNDQRSANTSLNVYNYTFKQ